MSAPAQDLKCGYCGGPVQNDVLYHLDGCDFERACSIHAACDSLSEAVVPPDLLAPIRAYADWLVDRKKNPRAWDWPRSVKALDEVLDGI